METQKRHVEKWPWEILAGNSTMKVYRSAEPTNASGIAYILAWQTASERKRQKFSAEARALAEARIKAAQLNAGRIEGADMTRGDCDELQAARKLAEGVPLIAAMEEWAKARQLTSGNVLTAAKAWAARNGEVEKRVKVSAVVKEFLKGETRRGQKRGAPCSNTSEPTTPSYCPRLCWRAFAECARPKSTAKPGRT